MKTLIAAVVLTLSASLGLALETDPIPGVDVKVGKPTQPPKKDTVAQGTTDADGSITFNDLPDGTYVVQFAIDGIMHEITGNEAGDRITVADGTSRYSTGARTSRAVAQPVVYTTSFGATAATVEVLGNSLKVSIAKQTNAAHTQRR
jgi:hypothetical protein